MSTDALLLNAALESISPSMNLLTELKTSTQMHPRMIKKKIFYGKHACFFVPFATSQCCGIPGEQYIPSL